MKIEPLSALAPVLDTCSFLQWCRDRPAEVSEPLWYAMLSNLARCAGGDETAHAFSKGYPGYTPLETSAKLLHARNGSGPITCTRIQELGFTGCPRRPWRGEPLCAGLAEGRGGAGARALDPRARHVADPGPYSAAAHHVYRGPPDLGRRRVDCGGEKLGKSYWGFARGPVLALGCAVAGRFAVPERRRVLVLEEEDPDRRVETRVNALLRGLDLDPHDPVVLAELDQWFLIEVWGGFTFDQPLMVAALEAVIAERRPAVVYVDALRKVTLEDLNKADQAGALLAELDRLRRRYRCLFRVLHHFRKSQGFRVGRGSQEIGGSFVLGAWSECALYFEPIGRKQGAVKVSTQSKDLPPMPDLAVVMTYEGPAHAPTLVRFTTEDITTKAASDSEERVYQAVATCPPVEARSGTPGVPWLPSWRPPSSPSTPSAGA